jgi:uncharacterized protein (DUF983 family)
MQKGFWYSVIKEKCPRCNEGDLYVNRFWSYTSIAKMPDNCPVCRQDYRIEDGFFLGATYISYAISVLLTIITLGIMRYFFHSPFPVIAGIMVIELIILLPAIVRISRSVWFNIFVHYEPERFKQKPE